MATPVRAVLFDKDGTLFDFQRTWSGWAMRLLAELGEGDSARMAALAEAIGFDLAARRFRPESPAIAGTPEQAARCLMPALPEMTLAALVSRIDAVAQQVELAEAVPLAPLLARLRASGLILGVATNDAEDVARAHLARAHVAEAFTAIFGCDSGHGAKPDPGMCLAFARAVGVEPAEVVMVGDSTHDLQAGRAAGMRCVAVLTGVAGRQTLAPWAEAVLPDIGHLPQWLGLAAG